MNSLVRSNLEPIMLPNLHDDIDIDVVQQLRSDVENWRKAFYEAEERRVKAERLAEMRLEEIQVLKESFSRSSRSRSHSRRRAASQPLLEAHPFPAPRDWIFYLSAQFFLGLGN